MKKLLSLLAVAGTSAIAITACGAAKADTEIAKEKQDSAKNTNLFSTSNELVKLVLDNPANLCGEVSDKFESMGRLAMIEDSVSTALSIVAEGKAQVKGENLTEEDEKYWSMMMGSTQTFYVEQTVENQGTVQLGTEIDWNFLTKASGRGLFALNVVAKQGDKTIQQNVVANYKIAESELNVAISSANDATGSFVAETTLVAAKIISDSTLVFAALRGNNNIYYAVDLETGEIAEGLATQDSWSTCSGSDTLDKDDATTIRLRDIHSGWMAANNWHPDYSEKINSITAKSSKADDIIGDKNLGKHASEFKSDIETATA